MTGTKTKRKSRYIIAFVAVALIASLFTVNAQAAIYRPLLLNTPVQGSPAGNIQYGAMNEDLWLFNNPEDQWVKINITHNDTNSAGETVNPGPNDRYDPTGLYLKVVNIDMYTTYPVVVQNSDFYFFMEKGTNLIEITAAKYCNPDTVYTITIVPD